MLHCVPRITALAFVCLLLLCAHRVEASLKPVAPRTVIQLDGDWQVAEGDLQTTPEEFGHSVPVPGLIDLAQPAFSDVGKKSPRRQAFWYRRSFVVPSKVPAVAILKIHKAKYGAKVWLNGRLIGEHLPCFTPAYLGVRASLKGSGQTNELIVRVGADRESMPQDMPTGWDFEKYLYLPGIYDSVELILADRPYIRNVQVVPDIDRHRARVFAEIESGKDLKEFPLECTVSAVDGTSSGATARKTVTCNGKEVLTVDMTLDIEACRLWSPEDPFLYRLSVDTGSDAVELRFGMRSFHFDPRSKRAMLNGKPYYLRGSNITLYRFFEDARRGSLPWNREWVRQLHRRAKEMNWNSLRYCIGFPPEFWYDIADEEGILLQDEFPIWLLNGKQSKCPEWPVAEKIIPEYRQWMRERWNHAAVVIWDAQNESVTPETAKALRAVRHLDHSNRPWENGWAEPQAATDCVESHPYLFIRNWTGQKPFRMSELAKTSGVPRLQAAQKKLDVPIIINEYAWLWLTREGDPTCLTDTIYENLTGPNSTAQQRRMIYARYLAALTEFWRAHRACAGVLHFCTLGYSRPGDKPRPEGGATSDHWLDVEKLQWEPLFQKYVSDAFNPVGIMLDFWSEEVKAESKEELKVHVINDLYQPWKGEIKLSVRHDGKQDVLNAQPCEVAGLGRRIVLLKASMPEGPGKYTLVAELTDHQGNVVRSLRDFTIK